MLDKSKNRLAKNTIYLYVRLLFSLVISFYTSRVVLQTLGITDFGIYGVVGGVVSLFSFLNTSLAGATSRFITIEIGRDNSQQLKKVIGVALSEHIIISGLFFIVAESIGLWIINTWLKIPVNRLYVANIVYQMSIVTMGLSIIQVPFRACIIAFERMDYYAGIEIVRNLLNLGSVFILLLAETDKLGFYSILVTIISLIVLITYVYICNKKILYFKCRCSWNKTLLKEMATYSGWDLFGNLSFVARNHGVSILLNIFFGPAINSAFSVALQAGNSVLSFVSNVATAVRPQIIKAYAQQSYNEMTQLMHHAVRTTLLMMTLLCVPLILEMHFVLNTWLTIVPGYATLFCIFILLMNLFSSASGIVVVGVHATGDLKVMSMVNGTLYLLVIPISYVAFRMNMSPLVPLAINVLTVFLGLLSNAYIVSRRVTTYRLTDFIVKDLLPCVSLFVFALVVGSLMKFIFEEGIVRFVSTVLVSETVICFLGIKYLLPKTLITLIGAKLKQLL